MELGQLYHGLSVGSYALSGVCFVLAVYLFFRWHIIDIFNELSGRTLKKNMERLSALSGASSEGHERRDESEAREDTTDTLPRREDDNGGRRRLVIRSSHGGSDETEVLFGGGSDETEELRPSHGGGYARGRELDVLLSGSDSTEELGELDLSFPGRTELPDRTELLDESRTSDRTELLDESRTSDRTEELV